MYANVLYIKSVLLYNHFDETGPKLIQECSKKLFKINFLVPLNNKNIVTRNEKNFFCGLLNISGLNLNNINLIDLLYGNMVPGIYLKTRENIELNPNFKPNMKKLHAHSKR